MLPDDGGGMEIFMNNFKIIDGKKAKEKAKSGEYLIIDLREKSEYEKEHIDTAISFPDATINDIERMNSRDKKWIVYCNRGGLSFRLAAKMARMGYDVTAVRGGIDFDN